MHLVNVNKRLYAKKTLKELCDTFSVPYIKIVTDKMPRYAHFCCYYKDDGTVYEPSIVINPEVFTYKKELLDFILKHEFAHYVCTLRYGKNTGHGVKFGYMCRTLEIPYITGIKVYPKGCYRLKCNTCGKETITEKIMVDGKKISLKKAESALRCCSCNSLITVSHLKGFSYFIFMS